jgi:multidrug resistance efflux pump
MSGASKKKGFPLPKTIPLAAVGLIGAIIYVAAGAKEEPTPPPLRQPPEKPYTHTVAGVGIIEGYGENTSIAPFRAGKVSTVYVKEGQRVKAGDPLYALDDAELRAQLQASQADQEARKQALELLRHQPRPEDLPPLKAAVAQAEANVADLSAQVARLERVTDKRAVSQDELSKKRYALASAEAQAQRAQAELKRTLAGAWRYDIQKAQADWQASQARVRQTRVLLDQSIVRATEDGEILQVNVHPGEFVATNPSSPPVLMGKTHQMQVRVDVDEIDASRVRPEMPATASLKGDPAHRFPLTFVRIEPYMVPKKNLTGASNERVDVRVLQLIYAFTPPSFPVYTGQQVDVFLKESR